MVQVQVQPSTLPSEPSCQLDATFACDSLRREFGNVSGTTDMESGGSRRLLVSVSELKIVYRVNAPVSAFSSRLLNAVGRDANPS